MDSKSKSGASVGMPSLPSEAQESAGTHLPLLFQSTMSEGAKRSYLLKLRTAAFRRLPASSTRKPQT